MPTDYNTEKIHHSNYASVCALTPRPLPCPAPLAGSHPASVAFRVVDMLDPHDALFTELGNKYVARMAEEWGTDHIYQTDTCE